MDVAELKSIQELLGETDEDLALSLLVPQSRFKSWVSGQAQIPKRVAAQLRTFCAQKKLELAMEAANIPHCEWMDRESTTLPDPGEMRAYLQRIKSHAASCAVCKARHDFASQYGGAPAIPRLQLIDLPFAAIAKLPEWSWPAVLGASLLAALTAARMLFLWPIAFGSLSNARESAFIIFAAAAAGASGGLMYSAVHKPFRKLGAAGSYLTGIACAHSYIWSIAAIAPRAFGEPLVHDATDKVFLAIVASVFGIIGTHVALRDS